MKDTLTLPPTRRHTLFVKCSDGDLSNARATCWTPYKTATDGVAAAPSIMCRTGLKIRLAAAAGVTGGVLLVGWVDYATGAEVQVLALYFLPLLLAGWSLGTAGAILAAVASTAVWLGTTHALGIRFAHSYIWVVNGVTQMKDQPTTERRHGYRWQRLGSVGGDDGADAKARSVGQDSMEPFHEHVAAEVVVGTA